MGVEPSGMGRIGKWPNYTQFDETGHMTFHGNARPWIDELGDALSLQQSGSGVDKELVENTVRFSSGATYHATFASADAAVANLQLNHCKDLSSSIYPHIHFFQTSNAAPNFLLEYRWQVDFGEKVTAWTKLKCNQIAQPYSGTTKNNIAKPLTPIPIPEGTTLSDIIQFRIYRDTANASGLFSGADAYSGYASILFFDVHYQIDSLGSTDEFTK